MGNNSAFTIMEATVIGAYNLGVLDKKLLTVIMKPYAGSDIDSGGQMDLKTKDGLGIEEVVAKVMGKSLPERPKTPRKAWSGWSEDQRDAYYEYQERVDRVFNTLCAKFGW